MPKIQMDPDPMQLKTISESHWRQFVRESLAICTIADIYRFDFYGEKCDFVLQINCLLAQFRMSRYF